MNTHVAALLTAHPSPVAPAPLAPVGEGLFSFLDQTHRNIAVKLRALREVVEAIDLDGLTPEVQARAREVHDWFNSHALTHHRDEEKHIFPALLADASPQVREIAQRLTMDHGWLEQDWVEIAPSLAAAANGNQWFDLDVLRHAVDVFEQLYLDHIVLEESFAYPQARQRIPEAQLGLLDAQMARRRALREAARAR